MASVFEEVRSAEAALSRAMKALEPGALDVKGAKKLVDLFTRCERLAIAGRGHAALRVQDAVNWKKDGQPSAAHWFASATGTSVGAASRSLGTARKLEQLPETAEAFRSGELLAGLLAVEVSKKSATYNTTEKVLHNLASSPPAEDTARSTEPERERSPVSAPTGDRRSGRPERWQI